MPSFVHSIPGGAATQIGMGEPPKPQQQPMPAAPQPTQPQQPQQQPQQQQPQQEANLVVRNVRFPDGTIHNIRVPEEWGGAEVKDFLIDRGVKGFPPDGSDIDRLVYGFSQGENIASNTWNYVKSRLPVLAGETTWTPENGVDWIDAADIYGDDFFSLSPRDRRKRMEEVDAANLQAEYPEINPNNLGKAGTAGAVLKGIADPAVLVPGGAALKGVKTGMQVAKQTAKVGGAWGAAWGGSEVLADKGIPTSLKELGEAAPRVLEPAAVGAVMGPALGVTGYKIGKTILNRNVAKAVAANPEKAANFARKKYWPLVWEEQMKGKSAAEATSAVRKHLKIDISDEWRLRQVLVDEDLGWARRQNQGFNRQGTALYSTATSAKDAAKRFGEAKTSYWGDPILHSSRQQWVDDLLRPIAGVVKDISPRIYKRLVDMEGNILAKTHAYHEIFHPFRKGVKKLRKVASEKDFNDFSTALFNRNSAKAKDIWLRHGMDLNAFTDMQVGLTTLKQEMRRAGIDFSDMDDYFPRLVSDYKGFREQAGRLPALKGLDEHLNKAARKKGDKLTDSETTRLINDWMEGMAGTKKRALKKQVASLKSRKVHEVTNEMLPYYYNPATSLEFHLREALSKIERNKFYGKDAAGKSYARMDDAGVENVSKSIGALMHSEGITGADAVRLTEVLTSRFGYGEHSGRKTLSALRQLTGGVTLGNPISAIRNLGDIPSIMKTQGVTNTLISMFKRNHKDINADVFGYMLEMAQEMDTKGTSAWVRKASHVMYKYGGLGKAFSFRSIDRFSKNVTLTAALRRAQKSVKTPKSKIEFTKKYSDIYTPDELGQLMDDLAKDHMTDLVKSHVNAELMRIQPISRSQMPKKYLDHPNGRMAYQFRTWGLNQIELFRQDVWRGMRSGDKAERRQAARAGVMFMAGVGTTNVAISEIQKVLTFRDSAPLDTLSDDVFWQAMANFGLDRYGMEKFAESGNAEEYLDSFLPPAATIPATFGAKLFKFTVGEVEPEQGVKDVLKETGFGRLVNFWFLGGAEEWNEKNAKRIAQEQGQQSVWSR